MEDAPRERSGCGGVFMEESLVHAACGGGCEGDGATKLVRGARSMTDPRSKALCAGQNEQMNDGCHWRKYGQKISKGNPFLRAYYRCTVASSCPMRKQVGCAINKDRSMMDPDSKALCSGQNDQDDQLESARVEMGQVREENKRLKMCLDRIMRDYETLQMQFFHTTQQKGIIAERALLESIDKNQEIEKSDLVSLRLGTCSSEPKRSVKSKTSSQEINDDEQVKESSLSLGLDCKFEASNDYKAKPETLTNSLNDNMSSFEDTTEDASEIWPPSKVSKTMRNGGDEVLQQNRAKKVRVCVRARCDARTMNDGCQWRKYGQKFSKGNPCPRAYYQCTVAPSCPVRKQVQRCAEDMTILISTYEGTHNHPLPIPARVMASSTSAVASMLLSGSMSTFQTCPTLSTINTTNNAAGLHGLSFDLLSNNSTPEQYHHVHNSSLSYSLSCPTITLDLVSTPSSASSFNRLSSTHPPIPKFASPSLNFSSSEPNTFPWGNVIPNYGSSTAVVSFSTPYPYTRSCQLGASLNQANFIPNIINPQVPHEPHLAMDTIAAATNAITEDPNFQSAIAAAFASIIGTSSTSNGGENSVGGENLAQKLKWGDHFPIVGGSNHSVTPKGIATASNYLNKTSSSTISQPTSSLMFLPTSLPFSSPGNTSKPPDDNRDP